MAEPSPEAYPHSDEKLQEAYEGVRTPLEPAGINQATTVKNTSSVQTQMGGAGVGQIEGKPGGLLSKLGKILHKK